MEKAMSVEEKIRRAEQIYNRRNGKNYEYKDNSKVKKNGIMSRLIKQIIICFLVYICFYVGNNKEYFLSNEFQEKIEDIVSQNEVTERGYKLIKNYLGQFLKKTNINDEENIELKNENSKETGNGENIGGISEKNAESDEKEQNDKINIPQEEKDIEEIKEKTSFIIPVEGKITSTFGWRTPTTPTVPKYHTGLDIAATEGTIIQSATDGKIIVATNQGDYGKHYKVQIEDITIIYAHCSKLYFNEGEEIKQGQSIAEVGSTGNSTGPHLHFEVRRQDHLIDPQLILNIM